MPIQVTGLTGTQLARLKYLILMHWCPYNVEDPGNLYLGG